jgi:hypothetical protein
MAFMIYPNWRESEYSSHGENLVKAMFSGRQGQRSSVAQQSSEQVSNNQPYI